MKNKDFEYKNYIYKKVDIKKINNNFLILKNNEIDINIKIPKKSFKIISYTHKKGDILKFTIKRNFALGFSSLIDRHIKGLSTGWLLKLEIRGRGYSIKIKENKMYCNLGYCHSVMYKIPEGVYLSCLNKRILYIFGYNFNEIANLSYNLLKLAPMNPYKDKGLMRFGTKYKTKLGKRT